jgi:hypothetical protein
MSLAHYYMQIIWNLLFDICDSLCLFSKAYIVLEITNILLIIA